VPTSPQTDTDHHRTAPAPPAGTLVLHAVRHGESAGNVAAHDADVRGLERIEIEHRDADTPLSALGEEQARAVGARLRTLDDAERPVTVWCSPYVRARQTAHLALAAAGLDLPLRVDDRLRDRELGVLDRLTRTGVERLHPAEAAARRHLGKMYHRPAGGESWVDVALRLRSWAADVRDEPGPLLVVTHDAVVVLLRYVLEHLDEDEVMELVREHGVRNASLTTLVRADGTWRARRFDEVDHLRDVAVTDHAGETR